MQPVVIRSSGRLSSLGWLALGFFFGLPLVAVGLAPGGKPINLFVGGPILVFFVSLALWDLGRSDVLILDAGRLQVLLLRGHFHRRQRMEFPFKSVSRLVLVTSLVMAGGRHSSKAKHYDLRLELKDGRLLVLSLGRRHDAEDVAALAGRTLGLPVEQKSQFGFSP